MGGEDREEDWGWWEGRRVGGVGREGGLGMEGGKEG